MAGVSLSLRQVMRRVNPEAGTTDWDKMRDIAAKMEHQIELLTDAVDELKNERKALRAAIIALTDRGTVEAQLPPAPESPVPRYQDDRHYHALMELVSSVVKTKTAYLCVRLGVADALAPDGSTSKTADELCTELAMPNPDRMHRLLRIMAALGLLQEHPDARFSLTPMGAALRTDHPASAGWMTLLWNMPIFSKCLDNMFESVRDDKPGVELAFGEDDIFTVMSRPEHHLELHVFNKWMTSTSETYGRFITRSIRWAGVQKVVDLAGAEGTLLKMILRERPGMQGVNVDLPHVIDSLAPVEGGFQGRLTHVRGDFFKPLPREAQGADVVTLKLIMHSWGDDECAVILRNAAAALNKGGRIIIMDVIIPDATDTPAGSMPWMPFVFDFMMTTVSSNGRERSMREWNDLFQKAGFTAPPEVVSSAPLSALVLTV